MASVLGGSNRGSDGQSPPPNRNQRPANHLRDINVLQGDSQVSKDIGACLTTILGSCVAVCLYDASAKVAGMNHFLLPVVGNGSDSSLNPRSGIHVMELLINGMLKLGARKSHMSAKVVGGAMMIGTKSNVGGKNADFALQTLQNEGIQVLDKHIGGVRARRLRFEVETGNLHMQLMKPAEDLVKSEAEVKAPKFESGSIDLF